MGMGANGPVPLPFPNLDALRPNVRRTDHHLLLWVEDESSRETLSLVLLPPGLAGTMRRRPMPELFPEGGAGPLKV